MESVTPWLPLIGTVLTSIVTAAGILIANRRKVLGYAITTNTPLVTIKDSTHAQQIEIRYNGRLVTGLRSIQVIIQNIGTKDIEEQSVDCVFPSDILVMNYQVGFIPPTFQKSATIQPLTTNHIRIHYALINPGDKTLLDALTANNEKGELQVHARGPNLKFKKFDPTYFISPTVNRVVIVIAASCWFGFMTLMQTGKLAEMEIPKRILFALVAGLLLGLPLAAAIYQGIIHAVKRLLERIEKIERQRTHPTQTSG